MTKEIFFPNVYANLAIKVDFPEPTLQLNFH